MEMCQFAGSKEATILVGFSIKSADQTMVAHLVKTIEDNQIVFTQRSDKSYVIAGGCHKINSLHSIPCHSLLSLYLKMKEFVNWIVKSDIELPFSRNV